MNTAGKIEEITDPALFERLASAVLRRKFPVLENLIESGTNAAGKSVKDPLDAFAQIQKNEYAYIAYTTDKNLKRKWLNNPATTQSKKGDLLVLADTARRFRTLHPQAAFIFYFVTNQRVKSELNMALQEQIPEDYITIVLVEQSILADYLDYDKDGQYLRKQFFQIDQELFTLQLLGDISGSNLQQYAVSQFLLTFPPIQTRAIDQLYHEVISSGNGLMLLTGESGSGKSIAAYQLMKNFQEQNKPVLRLSPEVIEQSTSLFSAIEHQLLKENSKMDIDRDLMENLFSEKSLLVVDDINKHSSPVNLLEKLISWAQDKSFQSSSIAVLCPVWPKNLFSINESLRHTDMYRLLSLQPFTRDDGAQLIKTRTAAVSLYLSDADIIAILNETNADPLLLSLFVQEICNQKKYIPNQGPDVIHRFIEKALHEVAKTTGQPEFRLSSALLKMGAAMLAEKNLNPAIADLDHWFVRDNAAMQTLEMIGSQKLIFSFDKSGQVLFRHDRIRDHLLNTSLEALFENLDANQNIFEEPFYAEFIGNAIAHKNLPALQIDQLLEWNPLSVFYALKFVQPEAFSNRRILLEQRIIEWYKTTPGPNIGYAVLQTIGFTVMQFDIQNSTTVLQGIGNSMEADWGRFRNGDVEGGVRFFMRFNGFDPAHSNYWRNVIMDHVRKARAASVIAKLEYYLNVSLHPLARRHVYLLAGYFQSPSFLKGLQKQWEQYPDPRDLLQYLWALIQCIRPEYSEQLRNAFIYWGAMEDRLDSYGNPDSIKAEIFEQLSRTHWVLDEQQITILTGLLGDDQYAELIYAILAYADSPIALKEVIKLQAMRKDEQRSKSLLRVSIGKEQWDFDKRKVRLSEKSRSFLLSFWSDTQQPADERSVAFRFWCRNEVPEIVIKNLQKLPASASEFYKDVLFWRLYYGDASALPAAEQLIDERPWVIRQLYKIWNAATKDFFTNWLKKAISEKSAPNVAEGLDLLQKIPREDAETLLQEFWEVFQNMKNGFLTALYIATPVTRELARKKINELGFDRWQEIRQFYQGPSRGHYILSKEIDDLSDEVKARATFLAEEFRYSYMHYGMMQSDHPRKPGKEELESLLPYFDLIDSHGLMEIAEYCDRAGYREWMEKNLFHRLAKYNQEELRPTVDSIVAEMDRYFKREAYRSIPEFLQSLRGKKVTREQILESLAQIAQKYQTLQALLLICQCLEQMGTRMDLHLIQNFQVTKEEDKMKAVNLVANTSYDVYRNSLK